MKHLIIALTPLTDKGSGSGTEKKHKSSICGQWFSSGSVWTKSRWQHILLVRLSKKHPKKPHTRPSLHKTGTLISFELSARKNTFPRTGFCGICQCQRARGIDFPAGELFLEGRQKGSGCLSWIYRLLWAKLWVSCNFQGWEFMLDDSHYWPEMITCHCCSTPCFPFLCSYNYDSFCEQIQGSNSFFLGA